MKDLPKSSLILKILYIFTPLLMVFTIVVLVYAWYTNTLQTGEINATTKNFVVEYTFDDDTNKNVLTYTVDDLSFFEYEATEEIGFLEGQAIPLQINLANKSNSALNYTITFKATKTVLTESNQVKSVAYVGCILDFNNLGTSIKDTYDADTNHVNYTAADYNAANASNTNTLIVQTTGTLDASADLEDPETDQLTIYLFGIQEIYSATNNQFIYQTENNVQTLRSYTFELTIFAEPISNSSVEENQGQ